MFRLPEIFNDLAVARIHLPVYRVFATVTAAQWEGYNFVR